MTFKSYKVFAKRKYSEIPFHELTTSWADTALYFLIKNSYVKMSAYHAIEVRKLMDCLKILKLEVNIKQNYYPSYVMAENEVGQYEFILGNFIDDRK